MLLEGTPFTCSFLFCSGHYCNLDTPVGDLIFSHRRVTTSKTHSTKNLHRTQAFYVGGLCSVRTQNSTYFTHYLWLLTYLCTFNNNVSRPSHTQLLETHVRIVCLATNALYITYTWQLYFTHLYFLLTSIYDFL